MSTQNIMWTALPNGLNAAGDRLKLSVLVSPRLITNSGASGTLAEFPDFIDWPATVAKLRFEVEIQGGATFPATPVTEPSFPGLDSLAWKALFTPSSPVVTFAFEDKSPLFVRSYPTKNVLAFVEQQYRAFAVAAADHKPSLSELGSTSQGARVPAGSVKSQSETSSFRTASTNSSTRCSHTTARFPRVRLIPGWISTRSA